MGGQTLSKLRGSLITRPIQRFNIESRTEKLLKEEKPIRAPHYPSTEELVENIRRERPDIIEESSKKDTDLLKKLQNVYVSSNDPEFFDQDSNTKVNYDNPERPMPGKGPDELDEPAPEPVTDSIPKNNLGKNCCPQPCLKSKGPICPMWSSS